MMPSIHLNMPYQDLLLKLVYNLQSEECVLHRCSRFPAISNLQEFLMQLKILETRDTIIFKQWLLADRFKLETIVKTVDEFVEIFIDKLCVLTHHHFIAKAQSTHLKDIKQNLTENQCLVLVDFSENYNCIVQDAVQGFHSQNIQATVHSFVVYFEIEEELKSLSMCFISV